ncbi:MAG: hypothetical protein CMJ46_12815 [Planctomyces sp.]|nr:hypothetical protein [Planctomyces sp.]
MDWQNPFSAALPPFSSGRRHTLQVGGLGLLGLSLPQLLRADETANDPAPKADACILLMLNGGPSHLDMWDMKPDQSEGIRGEFQPIPTSLPGYFVSEHMPRLARQMHLATVVRSMHHGVNNAHAAAVYAAMTGHDRGEVGGGTLPTDNPAPGSVLAHLRPPEQPIISNVHLPYITKEGATGPPQPGFFGGYMGHGHDPFFVLRDPNDPTFKISELTLLADVTHQRLDRRRQLFDELDQRIARRAAAREMGTLQGRAFDLLSSATTQDAFNLDLEPAAVRDSYGRNIYGQSVLLGRRLIEAGTRMVTVSWAPDANATWDTHGNNFKSLKNTLLPQFDAACSSLISDLEERGMLERTLVAVMGDFGRSPKVNAAAGRDHWNFCYSLMMVGGGFKRGLIYGSSDSQGGFPASLPTTPGQIVSTLYHTLGIAHDRTMFDIENRPHRLVPNGDVVADLLI